MNAAHTAGHRARAALGTPPCGPLAGKAKLGNICARSNHDPISLEWVSQLECDTDIAMVMTRAVTVTKGHLMLFALTCSDLITLSTLQHSLMGMPAHV